MAREPRPAGSLPAGRGRGLRPGDHYRVRPHPRAPAAAAAHHHLARQPAQHRPNQGRPPPAHRPGRVRPARRGQDASRALDGLQRTRQRAERHQCLAAGGVLPGRRPGPGHRGGAAQHRGAGRPQHQPRRHEPLRRLGEFAPQQNARCRPRQPGAERGVARRPLQPLLVRPQPRLAALAAPRVAGPPQAVSRLEAQPADRPPRDGNRLHVLFSAGRALAQAPAHAPAKLRADPGNRGLPRPGAGQDWLAVLHGGELRRLLLRQGLDLSRRERGRGHPLRASQFARARQ